MKILIFGDIASWNMARFEVTRLRPDLVEKISKADLVIFNLEGPIGKAGPPIEFRSNRWLNAAFRGLLKVTKNQQPQVHSNASILELLKLNPRSVAALANNHVKDLGKEGLAETLKLLDKHQIRHLGAGMNLQEANAPLHIDDLVIYNVNWVGSKKYGLRFGVYNATARDFGSAWLSLGQLHEIRRSVPTNKKSLLILHAGKESKLESQEIGIDLQAVSELGFDLTVIHHFHHYIESAFEERNLFLLGHFVFLRPGYLKGDRASAFLEVEVTDRVNARLHHFRVNEIYDY